MVSTIKISISILRDNLPLLMQHFGFKLTDINGELMNVHKHQEEEGVVDKDLAELYTEIRNVPLSKNLPKFYPFKDNETRCFRIIDYVLATNDKISISVSKDFQKRAKGIIELCKNPKFLKEYDAGIAEVLVFMAALWNRDKNGLAESCEFDEFEWEANHYNEVIRPDLLHLYITRNTLKNSRYHSFCSIQLGNSSPLKLEKEHCWWFERMLDAYLEQNLGVKSVKEAKRELLTNYGNKAGAPMDKQVASYIWGTYHLLQTLPFMVSKKEKKCSRSQSRFIAEYLNIVGVTDIYETDSEAIRRRLNRYLKEYSTLEDLLSNPTYKPRPVS